MRPGRHGRPCLTSHVVHTMKWVFRYTLMRSNTHQSRNVCLTQTGEDIRSNARKRGCLDVCHFTRPLMRSLGDSARQYFSVAESVSIGGHWFAYRYVSDPVAVPDGTGLPCYAEMILTIISTERPCRWFERTVSLRTVAIPFICPGFDASGSCVIFAGRRRIIIGVVLTG